MILPPPTQPLTSLQKLGAMYGTAIHHDNGTQLESGITEDKLWQVLWREIVALSPQRYDVPAGRVGCIFIDALAEELKGTMERRKAHLFPGGYPAADDGGPVSAGYPSAG